MHCRTILAVLAIVTHAAAQPSGDAQPSRGAQPAGDDRPARLTYAAYGGGLNVMELEASVEVGSEQYRVQLNYHLTGLLGALLHGQSTSLAEGRFQAGKAQPRTLFSMGNFRGRPRVTQIDWHGGMPAVTQLQPPIEPDREPVRPEERSTAIDSLSAMAALLHQAAASGRCDGAATTFDGRRLATVQARTAGEETLPRTSRSSFQGQALRCDFVAQQIAGFVTDSDQPDVRRPLHGAAWLARPTPSSALVPVRIEFETRGFGMATIYLTAGS